MSVPEISSLAKNDFDDCIASVCRVICENNGIDMKDVQCEVLEIFSRGSVAQSSYFEMQSRLIN